VRNDRPALTSQLRKPPPAPAPGTYRKTGTMVSITRDDMSAAVRLYTAVQAADLLGVSDDFIYSRWADHSLRCVDIGNNGRKKLRVRADDLQAFIDARTA
jgi:excisionase family DNA binding protein